ncbi:hypothetical protein EK21DRAFT_114860 [Setomelanomma holmii]|uniref:Uncharacterized protein n=1 Tax=Setomelanomma holmii TaxID=210430 RepID=A0A9P4H4J0_9PLEO|nr:hypothetical protein EK21DRAFT_114860 [Setomelanomma holmii]
MAFKYSSSYVITVDVTNYDKSTSYPSHPAFKDLADPPDTSIHSWCKVFKATIQDKHTAAKLASSTAHYINTARLDEDDFEFDQVRAVCPAAGNLVDLDMWASPLECECEGDDPEQYSGLIVHELNVEAAYRRQGLGRRAYLPSAPVIVTVVLTYGLIDLVQALIDKLDIVAKQDVLNLSKTKDEKDHAAKYHCMPEVYVALACYDPSAGGYHRRVARRRALGQDPTKEEAVKPGSATDIARRFWRACWIRSCGLLCAYVSSESKEDGGRTTRAESKVKSVIALRARWQIWWKNRFQVGSSLSR